METNNNSCTDNCSPRLTEHTDEQTTSTIATEAQHATKSEVVNGELTSADHSNSVEEGEAAFNWNEIQEKMFSTLLSEQKKKSFGRKVVDRTMSRANESNKTQTLKSKITKGNKKPSVNQNRHPAYARFQQRYQASAMQRRAQLLSVALQNAFRDIDSLFSRNTMSHFVKSPAYIRQRIAAEFPPPSPVRTAVFPGYSTPLSAGRVCLPQKPSLPVDMSSEPTTIPLADKERLQAFYDSLPKEMATELAKMVGVHASRAPADAVVSLVLRPLPEHLQVNGKRKFEVNLKYTKLVSVSSPAPPKRTTRSKTSSQSTPRSVATRATKGTKPSASKATVDTIAKKPRNEKDKKTLDSNLELTLEKKHLLWPKKHIIHMIRKEHFSQLSLTAAEKILRKSFQQYGLHDLNNTTQPRWAYTSLRRLIAGLCRAIETTSPCCEKIAWNEVLTLACSLNSSLIGDDTISASNMTALLVNTRWELYSTLERAVQSVLRSNQPTNSVHIAQIWSRIEKLLQTGSSTSFVAPATTTTTTTTTMTSIATSTTSTPSSSSLSTSSSIPATPTTPTYSPDSMSSNIATSSSSTA